MKSHEVLSDKEHTEKMAFLLEAQALHEVLGSYQQWAWPRWVPTVQEPVYYEGSSTMDPRLCWQIPGVNLYLGHDGSILQRDHTNKLTYASTVQFRGQMVDLTAKMREMRENLQEDTQ